MSKVIALFLTMIILTSCSKNELPQTKTDVNTQLVKGVWIYYDEISMVNEKGGTAETFERKIEQIYNDCKQFGLNTVFVQIRPFADSFYPSQIFPWSKYLTGVQGQGVSYDPLKIMINCARKCGLSFHAWINPFRISFDNNIENLSDSHPALKQIDSDFVYKSKKGLYFNPANIDAQKIILGGIREIAENYDVDGIHIDDYFYPDTDPDIDKFQYDNYMKNGGQYSLALWRTETINVFVSGMYNVIKSVNPQITVSISPAGNISNNYNSLFADVGRWSAETGYCDMIMPQLYFGFDHKVLPFESVLQKWSDLNLNNNIKLIAGIGAYKAVDHKNEEWKNPEIIKKQIDVTLNSAKYDGYCLFSYGSLVALKDKVELSSDAIGE